MEKVLTPLVHLFQASQPIVWETCEDIPRENCIDVPKQVPTKICKEYKKTGY